MSSKIVPITSKDENEFRIYDTKKDSIVKEQYRQMRINQTLKYAKRMKMENLSRIKKEGRRMNILDAIYFLNTFVDKSDPDTNLPNMYHFFQTAEGIRKDGLVDWMQLVGLIHDMGKMMFLWGKDEDGTTENTQWGLVGDTYILGCKLKNEKVYPEFDFLCPDMKDPELNTDMGIYEKYCGLCKCIFTWGHDEYLYDVLQYNKELGNVSESFPIVAYYIIRFHSLYPWHAYEQYKDLECPDDVVFKQYVQLFNKYDLYTKSDDCEKLNIDDLIHYYSDLIYKYFPNGYLIF
jgi:inositol oxygenase